jgi:hypothetical protein
LSHCFICKQVFQVSPYHPKYKQNDGVSIVQAAATYTNSETGSKYILIIYQVLYMKDLPNTLISPNQITVNGITVDNCPRHLASNLDIANHSIDVPNLQLGMSLKLKGILSYFPVEYQTDEELHTCQWVELTSNDEWNPNCESFEKNKRFIMMIQKDDDQTGAGLRADAWFGSRKSSSSTC